LKGLISTLRLGDGDNIPIISRIRQQVPGSFWHYNEVRLWFGFGRISKKFGSASADAELRHFGAPLLKSNGQVSPHKSMQKSKTKLKFYISEVLMGLHTDNASPAIKQAVYKPCVQNLDQC
jgi:hypothetical protein